MSWLESERSWTGLGAIQRLESVDFLGQRELGAGHVLQAVLLLFRDQHAARDIRRTFRFLQPRGDERVLVRGLVELTVTLLEDVHVRLRDELGELVVGRREGDDDRVGAPLHADLGARGDDVDC